YSTGRVLAAAPASGRALLWVGEGELPVEQVMRLLGLVATKGEDSDQPG
ncbi:MAG: hypothetical protein RL030_2293, partial [Pseudomonadota bacterium]